MRVRTDAKKTVPDYLLGPMTTAAAQRTGFQ
jgi:hypothetical protein